MAILEVPPEILAEILSEVPSLLDLLALGGVCKDFHQAFKGSVRLQYRIELEKSGMVNNSFCTLPTPARLEMLCECTQDEAVSHFIEGTCWSEDFSEFWGGKGTPKKRRTALRAAWRAMEGNQS